MTGQFVAELGNDYYARYPSILLANGAPEVLENAKLLDPEHMVFVVAGDKKHFESELARLGAVVENAPDALTD